MECPKCKAHNADEAVCCSLCYEMFKAKPAKSKEAKAAGSLAGFARVVSTVEDFIITGPMVIGDNGIHFFIKELTRNEDKRVGTQVGNQMGGIVGHMLGAMINHAVDESTEADKYRPRQLIYKDTRTVMDACQMVMGDAPEISVCKEFHTIEKKDIKSLSFGFLGGLTIKTQFLSIEVNGIDPKEKASANFKLKGYPIS